MSTQQPNFDNYFQEAHHYINELSAELGHPEEKQRVLHIWRAVMHTLRDRIHVAESFHVMAQLPTLMKGVFAENWTFRDKPEKKFETMEEMKELVEKKQRQLGETEFSWDKSTEEIIHTVVHSLKRYLTEGQFGHILDNLPKELEAEMK